MERQPLERHAEILSLFYRLQDQGNFRGPLVALLLRDHGYSIHDAEQTMRSLGFATELQAPSVNGQYILYMSRHPEGTQGVPPELVGSEGADPVLFGEVIFPKPDSNPSGRT